MTAELADLPTHRWQVVISGFNASLLHVRPNSALSPPTSSVCRELPDGYACALTSVKAASEVQQRELENALTIATNEWTDERDMIRSAAGTLIDCSPQRTPPSVSVTVCGPP